jgi:beta-lactamase regulating signal transducer with metallopeptidase domain
MIVPGLELLPLLLKATLIAGAAIAGAWLLRRLGASASARHISWLAAMLALLALPLLSLAVPPLDLPLLPGEPASAAAVAPPAVPSPANALPSQPAEPAYPSPAADRGEPVADDRAPVPLLPLIYAAGLAALLAWLTIGHVALLVLRRRARLVDDPQWLELLAGLASDLGVGTPVRLLMDAGSAMPMTWGTLRPSILLPDEARTWSAERRRFVLLHELAHIRRRDPLTQTISFVACAFYWFHPLVWLMAARQRQEQEHACDDLVLSRAGRPRSYAQNLLDLAGSIERRPLLARLSVAMAGRSEIEARLLAIVDRLRNRRPPQPRLVAAAGAIMACLTMLLAAANPVRASQEARPVEAVPPDSKPARIDRHGDVIVVQDWVKATPGGTLTVDVATGGELTISGWEYDWVGLEAQLRGRDREGTRVELSPAGGGDVRLTARQASDGSYSTSHRFVLHVPRRYSLAVRSGGGGITLTDLRGSFTGNTGGGPIALTRLSGEARLETGGGDIHVTDSELDGSVGTGGGEVRFENVRGSLRSSGSARVDRPSDSPSPHSVLSVEKAGGAIDIDRAEQGARLVTGGGDIRLGAARVFVDAQTGGGDILLGPVDGAVTATTGAGAVTVRLAGGGSGGSRDVVVRSGTGPVTIVLDPGVGAEFDVETGYTRSHGRPVKIRSDVALRVTESATYEEANGGTPRRYVRGSGRVGDGRYKVRIRTVNGDVRIVRGGSGEAVLSGIGEDRVESAAKDRAAASLEATLWSAGVRSGTEAVESLGELRDGAGLAALAKAAHFHPAAAVRSAAAEALGRIADDKAVEALSQLALTDDDSGVRLRAVRALSAAYPRTDLRRRNSPASIRRLLATVAESDPRRSTRAAAAEALEAITSLPAGPEA